MEPVFDIPQGPREVLFTIPTPPNVLTRATMDNLMAKLRAEAAYERLHLEEYGDQIQYAVRTGYEEYPLMPMGLPFRKTRRKPGSPSFESFFNANLHLWYSKWKGRN